MYDITKEMADMSLRAAPPLAVTATSIAGVPFESWVYVITFVYVGLQIGFLVYKWIYTHKRNKGK